MTQPLIEAPLSFRVRSGGQQAKGDALVLCPKCDAPCTIRHSVRVTETVKDIVCHCTNTGCAHTFLSQISFVYSYNPGLIDRPDLDLPVCPRDRVPHIIPPSRHGDGDPDQISMFASSA